ncbi:MAG: hypothetical protein KAI71_01045 [Candidatus Pacebacteria bacterium]|nr:hypothetical protein [Candidatus Paceibacterota bacterium]
MLFKYISYLSILFLNLIPIYGVLWKNWLVSDILFWYWLEFMIEGVVTYIRIHLYCEYNSSVKSNYKFTQSAKKETIFSFLFISMFATIFFLGPIMTEFREGRSIDIFVFEKAFMVAALIFSIVFLFWNDYIRSKIYLDEQKDFEYHTSILTKKSLAIALFYGILMIHYHLNGSVGIDYNSAYLLWMLVILMFVKTAIEMFYYNRSKDNIVIKN